MDRTIYAPLPQYQVSERVFTTPIHDLWYIDSAVITDERGFFSPLAQVPELDQIRGSKFVIKQVNQSRSLANVVRGIHAESWNKLVTVTHGQALCVISDVRPTSPDFLKTVSFILSKTHTESLPGSLFISSGLGNSICVLDGEVDYLYGVDLLYQERNLDDDVAVSLFDPDLQINWPIAPKQMILSERDREGKTLRQLYPDKF